MISSYYVITHTDKGAIEMVVLDRSWLTSRAVLEEVPGSGVVAKQEGGDVILVDETGLEQVASALNQAGVDFLNQGLYLRIETQVPEKVA